MFSRQWDKEEEERSKYNVYFFNTHRKGHIETDKPKVCPHRFKLVRTFRFIKIGGKIEDVMDSLGKYYTDYCRICRKIVKVGKRGGK